MFTLAATEAGVLFTVAETVTSVLPNVRFIIPFTWAVHVDFVVLVVAVAEVQKTPKRRLFLDKNSLFLPGIQVAGLFRISLRTTYIPMGWRHLIQTVDLEIDDNEVAGADVLLYEVDLFDANNHLQLIPAKDLNQADGVQCSRVLCI
ncbi:uncharacterized protein CIMG_13419 [Coccidioides immitis RS]|uniref:Uncharacterized protein n=1 Tax=Coccidioides immitis (strain RS) TaxID=246410 RepID=A0A0D8JXX3_COCIM|nr:uncharacterized protein CIMG_13419 [Coccidioides immitis RS]KJF61103.1 hypothetical protein CIMG_13419 [Coccidioides immitis RS]